MANPQTDGRMIRKSISDSNDFASLSPQAAVLFCMILPHLDTHGKLQGGPAFIKEIVCPKVNYLTIVNIPFYLQEICKKTDMKWFDYDSRYWIHAVHFTEHQKLDKNKIGKDRLPNYQTDSQELVQSKSRVSQELVDNKDKDKVEVKDKDKSMADAAFVLPSKEEIQEASDPLIEENIQKVSKALYEEHIFPDVHAFKNTMLKQKKNLRSILHTLTRVYLKKEFKDGPWAYGIEIIKLEDLNYNERDYQKTAQ